MVTYVLPKSQHSKYVKGALLADGSCARACRSTMTLADRSWWASTRGLCSALSFSPSQDVSPVSIRRVSYVLFPYVLSPSVSACLDPTFVAMFAPCITLLTNS